MKPKVLIFVVLTALASVGISTVLVPQPSEVALIRFRNREFDEARRLYEKMWSEGRQTVEVAIPLTQLYLQDGAVDRAVEIMETFVEAHPHNVEAHHKLAQYYQYAQRPNDYVRTLDTIAQLQPTESVLRELSASYNFTGDYSEQISTLQALLDLHVEEPQDFIDLVHLQANQGQYDAALSTLEELKGRHPEALNDGIMEMYANLAVDAGQPDRLIEPVKLMLEGRTNYKGLAHWISIVRDRGFPQTAWALLQTRESWVEESDLLLVEFIRTQVATGDSLSAYGTMLKLHDAESLPDALTPDLLGLSVARNHDALARVLARRLDPSSLTPWVQRALIEISVDRKQLWLVRNLSQGRDDLFVRDPLLGARVALALQQRAKVRQWLRRAREQESWSADRLLILADLHGALGEYQQATKVLESVIEDEVHAEQALDGFVRMHLAAGSMSAGLRFLDPYRGSSPAASHAWARLAVHTRRASEVLEALLHGRLDSSPSQLRELYYAATEADQADLALECARRLQVDASGTGHTQLLIHALLEAGKPREGLALARTLLPGSGETFALYHEALQQSWRSGAAVREELIAAWLVRAKAVSADNRMLEEATYALLDLQAHGEVLDWLEELAVRDPAGWLLAYVESAERVSQESRVLPRLHELLANADHSLVVHEQAVRVLQKHADPWSVVPYLEALCENHAGSWFYDYQDALRDLMDQQGLHVLWIRHAQRPDVSKEQKRDIAFQLLEAGAKEEAVAVFLRLADTEDAMGANVEQLLHLWGPRPPAAGIEWLAERARIAPSTERSRWLQRLFEAGSHQKVVELVEAQHPQGSLPDFDMLETYVHSLQKLGRRSQVEQVLDANVRADASVASLRSLARLAQAVDARPASIRAFELLLHRAPQDGEAHRFLGFATYFQGKHELAGQHLKAYLHHQPDDAEVLFHYGEVLRHQGHEMAASSCYRRAEKNLRKHRDGSLAHAVLEAQLVDRLGRHEQAFDLFKHLLQRHPQNVSLRAQFAALLMDNRQFDAAAALLQEGDGTP